MALQQALLLTTVVLILPWRRTSVTRERMRAFRWSAARPRRFVLTPWRMAVNLTPLLPMDSSVVLASARQKKGGGHRPRLRRMEGCTGTKCAERPFGHNNQPSCKNIVSYWNIDLYQFVWPGHQAPEAAKSVSLRWKGCSIRSNPRNPLHFRALPQGSGASPSAWKPIVTAGLREMLLAATRGATRVAPGRAFLREVIRKAIAAIQD